MHLSSVLYKVKNPLVMVVMKSVASGHRTTIVRPREEAKQDMIRFDPLVERDSVYKEIKKLKSIKYLHGDWQSKLG